MNAKQRAALILVRDILKRKGYAHSDAWHIIVGEPNVTLGQVIEDALGVGPDVFFEPRGAFIQPGPTLEQWVEPGDPVGRLFANISGEIFSLPKRGTPAAELTERDKVALAIAAGAPTKTTYADGKLTIETAVPIGVSDRGDGGWIVAIGR